jgi:hypothetical protein
MRVLVMAMAVVLSLATLGQAEPLALKQVAADAKWVMHVDVDAMRESTVVQKAYQKCLEMHKDAEKKMDAVCGMVGMDLKKDLHSATVYGKDTNKEHGVMIVHADVNQKLLLEMVAKAPDHKSATYGSYELHTWTHKGWKKESRMVVGTFYKPNVMVFAGCDEIVKAALDVLDGKSAGITGSESPLAGRTLPGSIFVARASAIDPKTRCPVLKQAESFRVALGENGGESFYRARLVMKSAEAIDQVKAITEGFQAMMALQHGSDAQAMKLIDGLKVASKDATLRIRWSASAEDVWTVVEKAAKKWAEQKGKGDGCPMCPGAAAGKCPLHGDSQESKPEPKQEEDNF